MGLRRATLCALAVSLAAPVVAQASDDEVRALREQLENQRRLIERLADRVGELENGPTSDPEEAFYEGGEEQTGRVGVFDAVELDLGGFLTQTLTLAHGEDDTDVSPNQTLLEILVRAGITDRISLFAALGWLREADLDLSVPGDPEFRGSANRTPQIIAWTNYRHRDSIQLRLGRFVTPHGIINIEHFPPTLLEINQPQFLRPFSGATLFPNFMNGGELHGRLLFESGSLQYSAYGGIFGPAPKDFLTGGRLEWSPSGFLSGVHAGLNYSHGSREAGGGSLGNFASVPSRSLVSNDYDLVGADLLIDRGRLIWKNEFFFSFEEHEENRMAFYSQPGIRLTKRWIAFYRFDYLDPGQGVATTMEHVAGLNFLPHPLVRLRAAGFYRDTENSNKADAIVGQLSATLSF
ncbi:MAG: hypothetical protein MJE66_02655 [Proteobacteria bacterium]|nr:hypothetical protein [Pseudomonadota bacterium]